MVWWGVLRMQWQKAKCTIHRSWNLKDHQLFALHVITKDGISVVYTKTKTKILYLARVNVTEPK